MYVAILIKGNDVPDPSLVGIVPSRDLKIFGPFEDPDVSAMFIETYQETKPTSEEENFVILPIEWKV